MVCNALYERRRWVSIGRSDCVVLHAPKTEWLMRGQRLRAGDSGIRTKAPCDSAVTLFDYNVPPIRLGPALRRAGLFIFGSTCIFVDEIADFRLCVGYRTVKIILRGAD